MKNLSKLESFFEVSDSSIQFLAWTSPIVAALLALTTIVFSQYNERLLNTSNEINKEIKHILTNSNSLEETLPEKINNLIFILQGKTLYSMNLAFFTIISILSCLAWFISGIGFYFNQATPSPVDIFVIIISIFIVTITFIGLPVLLIIFNKKTVVTLDFRNRLSYLKLSKYLKSLSSISDEKILMEYIQPSLQINLDYSNNISFQFKQEIPISKVFFIYEFKRQGFENQIIKMENQTTNNCSSYELASPSSKNYSYEGLYEKINNSETLNLYVFSKNKNKLLATFKLQKDLIQSSKSFIFFIDEAFRLSENNSIANLLNSKSNLYLKEEDELTKFSFKKTEF